MPFLIGLTNKLFNAKKMTMKFFFTPLLILTVVCSAHTQNPATQKQLDSIINEANRLYHYEKTVWHASDLLMEDTSMLTHYGGYVVNLSDEKITVTFAHENAQDKIAVYRFSYDALEVPFEVQKKTKPLEPTEKKLLDTKMKVMSQLGNEDYAIGWPEGFSPNFILLPETNGYKFYMIMGATESGVIPFGNDYVFVTDNEGNITNWKKFHTRLIPGETQGPNGEPVSLLMHSHLRNSPFISATDICTFRLYAPDYGIDEFRVLCIATSSYYTYSIKTNSITVESM
jgi:hypothetical protein